MLARFAAVLAAFLLVFGGVCFAAEEAPAKRYGQNEGDFLKPLTLKFAESDKKLDTEALSKRSIFMLVSSVCTACRTELEEITANMKEFQGKADLYAVIIDMEPAAAVARVKSKAPDVTLLADSEYALGSRVNMVSAPSTLIVEKDGKILYKKSGYNPGQWKEYARILAGK